MAKRPVFFPELAKYFTSLREDRAWKQAQAADIAARRGIALTYQALRGLEDGKTKNPEPELLRAVADLYEKPYEEIVSEFIRHRYGLATHTTRDLLRHGRTGQLDSPQSGESDVPTPARVRELQARVTRSEQERDAYKAIVEHAGELVAQLAVVIRPEGGTAARRKTARRSSHRKAG